MRKTPRPRRLEDSLSVGGFRGEHVWSSARAWGWVESLCVHYKQGADSGLEEGINRADGQHWPESVSTQGRREGEREKGRRGYWSASCPLSSPEMARKRATGKSFYTSLVSRDTVFVMRLKGYYPPKKIIYHHCVSVSKYIYFFRFWNIQIWFSFLSKLDQKRKRRALLSKLLHG